MWISALVTLETQGGLMLQRLINLFTASRHHRPSLEGLTATVFVRESNGSRTNLEHHLEQLLIERGVRVLVANQEAGTALLKRGEFHPLAADVNFAVVGTLIIRSGFSREVEEPESDEEFWGRKRQAEFEWRRWLNRKIYEKKHEPAPLSHYMIERRIKGMKIPIFHHQFSFRLVGFDGALLASGTTERFPDEGLASYEGELRGLAREAVAYLDRTNVWEHIVIE